MNNESFEEAQARYTGTRPGVLQRIRLGLKRARWQKIVIPAAFFAVMVYIVTSEIFADIGLPAFTPFVAAAIVFVTVALIALSNEVVTGGKHNSRG